MRRKNASLSDGWLAGSSAVTSQWARSAGLQRCAHLQTSQLHFALQLHLLYSTCASICWQVAATASEKLAAAERSRLALPRRLQQSLLKSRCQCNVLLFANLVATDKIENVACLGRPTSCCGARSDTLSHLRVLLESNGAFSGARPEAASCRLPAWRDWQAAIFPFAARAQSLRIMLPQSASK